MKMHGLCCHIWQCCVTKVSMQMELTDNVRVNGADLGIRVISTSAERAAERASQSDPAGVQFLAGSAAS